MSASMNRVLLIGNLGADPELKKTPGGKSVTTLRVATNEAWIDKVGEKHTRADWHRVVVWGDQAENCAKYLKKGRQVHIDGRLQTRTWDKEGQKQYVTEIVASRVTFLGGNSNMT